uniref:Immunoglobulin V-set domain-containing protein n=1 Tax=Callorhinchus milii TaxID=7868 RepID=A0A4W3I936_CALMI
MLCSAICDGDSVSQKTSSMFNKEGDTVTFDSFYSTASSDYYLFWYRHSPDKQPEFIVRRNSWSESQQTGTGFGNRFSAQLHKSNSYTS